MFEQKFAFLLVFFVHKQQFHFAFYSFIFIFLLYFSFNGFPIPIIVDSRPFFV